MTDTINACDYDDASVDIRTIQMLGHSMKAVSRNRLDDRFVTDEGKADDEGDLRFSVRVDTQEPVTYSLKEPFRSERWKLNVLNGQAVRDTKASLSKGSHTLTIRALDDHIVVDQIHWQQVTLPTSPHSFPSAIASGRSWCPHLSSVR